MSRDKLKDFLRESFNPASESISYKIDTDGRPLIQRGDDLGVDPNTGEPLLDLNDEGAGLLGDYIAYVIEKFGKNTYKLNPGNEKAASSNRGDALVMAEEQGAAEVFVESGTTLSQQLNMYSDSGYLSNQGITLGSLINKIGSEGTSDTLLKDVPGRDLDESGTTKLSTPGADDNKVLEASNAMLKRYNRFTGGLAGKPYANVTTSAQDFMEGVEDAGTTTSQRDFGNYDPDTVKYILDNVKSIGASLIYKMAGWDMGSNPGKSAPVGSARVTEIRDDNVSNDKHDRPNAKIPFKLARAKDAYGAPEMGHRGMSTRLGRGEFLSQNTGGTSRTTYGTTTTPATRAGDPGAKILRIQAAASIIAVQTLMDTFLSVVSDMADYHNEIVGDDDIIEKEGDNLGRGPYVMGRARSIKSSVDVVRKIALVDTEYPYSKCVDVGIKQLFGEEPKDKDKVKKTSTVEESPEFWLAVANNVLKSVDLVTHAMESLSDDDTLDDTRFSEFLSRSSAVGFMNVAATVGDLHLKATGGRPGVDAEEAVQGWMDIDSLPDGPGTRHIKSRSQNGMNSTSMAWRVGSMPSMYILPRNIVNATIDLNTTTVGTNPIKGMMGSDLIRKTYLDRFMGHDGEGSISRIPNDVVERMENRLDAEYVPFYFHDIRTNEIIAFHAFIDTLTDTISPTYQGSTSYGRMDPVQIYSSTSRNLNVGFYVYATNKQDFDEMWFKINKLVTLLYPQWTKGAKVYDNVTKGNFTQPFSQIIGASPLVRLRVGDVIKSNYSKFNLARVFGIGDPDIKVVPEDEGIKPLAAAREWSVDWTRKAGVELFYGLYGTPLQYAGFIPQDNKIAASVTLAAKSVASEVLENGFVNPMGVRVIASQLQDPDNDPAIGFNTHLPSILNAYNALRGAGPRLMGYTKNQVHYIKHSMAYPYTVQETGMKYTVRRPLRMLIKNIETVDEEGWIAYAASHRTGRNEAKGSGVSKGMTKTIYEVQIIDPTAPEGLFLKTMYITHGDILPNYNMLFNMFIMPSFASPLALADILQVAVNEAAVQFGIPVSSFDIINPSNTNADRFMNEFNNPIVRSFNTTRGRGLAGFMDSVTFDWSPKTTPWETDWNSRAPIGARISFNFKVVHDIPPGLDHSGFNRAPLYNVGDIMNHVAGDVYDDDGMASKRKFDLAGLQSNNPDDRSGG